MSEESRPYIILSNEPQIIVDIAAIYINGQQIDTKVDYLRYIALEECNFIEAFAMKDGKRIEIIPNNHKVMNITYERSRVDFSEGDSYHIATKERNILDAIMVNY
ncbi:MAG: hypothetical protein GX808_12645 [Syntrophomonadaceae bacterium]|jgi:hypothetical protein|nr:hypothetical protein [Syntrophomonadaceae bacterium]